MVYVFFDFKELLFFNDFSKTIEKLPIELIEEQPYWWFFNKEEFVRTCQNPEACSLKYNDEANTLFHRDVEYSDIVGSYYVCHNHRQFQKAIYALKNERISGLSKKFYRRGWTLRYVFTTNHTFMVGSYCEQKLVWMVRNNDHPIPLPKSYAYLLCDRIKYKLTRGEWAHNKEED